MNKPFHIFGIETSCDETAGAIVRAERGKLSVAANVVSSQIATHAQWGGVVPNIAAREHVANIIPVLSDTCARAGMTMRDMDLITVTNGPGLIQALLIGVNTAKTLSYAWRIPLIGTHHIAGHIYANWIGENSRDQSHSIGDAIEFPILCLVVSGGHTQLVLMKKHCDYTIIGQTQDDAAGEAFDKVARILGLSYPGGPLIASEAAKNSETHGTIALPRPMIDSGDYNFSFSGLKTAVLYTVKKFRAKNNLADTSPLPKEFVSAMAREFQNAVVDVLVAKTTKATGEYAPRSILLAGGVAANVALRQRLMKTIREKFPSVHCALPSLRYTTDNAAMIATAGYFVWQKLSAAQKHKAHDAWRTLAIDANLPLS